MSDSWKPILNHSSVVQIFIFIFHSCRINYQLLDCNAANPRRLDLLAITEMVPNLIWAPDFFGPQEIWFREVWAPHKNHYMAFLWRDQISWGASFSGPKFLGTQTSQGPIFWAQKSPWPKWDKVPFQLEPRIGVKVMCQRFRYWYRNFFCNFFLCFPNFQWR